MSPISTTGTGQTVGSKFCRQCQTIKPATEFYADPGKRDGLTSWCRQCKAERKKERRNTDPEFVANNKRAAADWRQNNRDAVRKSKAEWLRKNKSQHKLNQALRIEASGERARYKEAARLYAVAKLGSASNHMCVRCNKAAEHWHHWNYQRKYWASVVPVCRKCHSMHHHRQLKIPLSSKDAVQGAEY